MGLDTMSSTKWVHASWIKVTICILTIFFSSVKLAADLLEKKTYSCSTICVNRKGWPADLCKAQMKTMKKGKVHFRQDGNLAATVWRQGSCCCAVVVTNADAKTGSLTRKVLGAQKMSPFLNPSLLATPTWRVLIWWISAMPTTLWVIPLWSGGDTFAGGTSNQPWSMPTLFSRKLRNNRGSQKSWSTSVFGWMFCVPCLQADLWDRAYLPSLCLWRVPQHQLSPSILAGSETVFSARTSAVHQRDMPFRRTMDVFRAVFTYAKPHAFLSFHLQLAQQHWIDTCVNCTGVNCS